MQKEKSLGLPLGPNGRLIGGKVVINSNGDAEWYKTGDSFPTLKSNKSEDYIWKFVEENSITNLRTTINATYGADTYPTNADLNRAFYSTQSSIKSLNDARLNTFNSPADFNSPQLAKQLGVPGSTNTAQGQQGIPDQQAGAPSAPVLPAPGEQEGSVPISETQITAITSNVNLTPTSGGRFQYPLNMDSNQDKIKFIACEINPRGQSSGSGLAFRFPSSTYKKVGAPVYLAIQSPISDQNSVDWGPDSVNAIQSALYQESLKLMETDVENINLSGKLNDIVKTAGNYGDQIRKVLAGQAAGINNILARTDAAILNPNLELLFQGPQLRPFTFQFKMSARNEPEAKEIKKIIKYFKYYMAVRKSEDELFLKAPCVFTIQYCKGNQEGHPGINLISPTDETKACALTNCSVDYTPLGTYMTYDDTEATMVAYTLSLQFQELEPIYNTDYEINHPIGF